jgi:RHS repeat-associated protein
MTAFPGSRTALYDAENRQYSLTDGGTTQYVYDGEGRRVQKVVGGQTTTYVYDAAGNLAAEYGGAAQTAPCTRCYVTVDHLGSTRLVMDAATGNVMRRYDYTPFGGEIGPSWSGRTTATGYGSDTMEPKFTGKQRDYESGLGLDYFGARYFSAAMGRFTTPDWSAIPQPIPYADLTDPQTLNLYAYVRNNPLGHPDSDGHCFPFCSLIGPTTMYLATHPAAGAAVLGTADLAIGGMKAVAAGGLAAAGPETAGISAVGAVYLGIGSAGQLAAGASMIAGAITGNVDAGQRGADAAAAATTVAGVVILLRTKGDVAKAADAAAIEGLITLNPSELMEGTTAQRVANAADEALTVKAGADAVARGGEAGKRKAACPTVRGCPSSGSQQPQPQD